MKKVKPELNVGDRVFLIHMEDPYPSVSPGDFGVVRKVVNVLGVTGYEIDWDNGSKLSLWSDVDFWGKVNDSNKNITEGDENYFMSNENIAKNYNILFFVKYLKVLQKTGLVNMFGAAPYLYIGKKRLEKELDYKEKEITEPIIELLSIADEAQSNMVKGAIKRLEKDKKPVDVENINRIIKRDSIDILGWFINSF